MKKVIALLLLAALLGGFKFGLFNRFMPFEPEARAATGAIFVNRYGHRLFNCSGTEIGSTEEGDGIFLTARHCVADPDTNKLNDKMTVSFSDDQGGPFYDAAPIAISLQDDLALLVLRDGANIPEVGVKDEHKLTDGDPIFNVSFPLGNGKITFHGEYLAPRFPAVPPEIISQYSTWISAMPINLTIAHGSSGSGVFSKKEHALIGVVVGTSEEGSYNIAIPSDRVQDFLNDLPDNTVKKFKSAFPDKAKRVFWLF